LILHCSIRSITNKHDDFVGYLESLDHKFLVIGLTETWLNSNNVNNFPLYQYSFVGRVRNYKIGGGVGLYVNQSYQYRERHDLSIKAGVHPKFAAKFKFLFCSDFATLGI